MYDFRRRHTMLNAMDKSQMPWYGKNLIFHARIKIAFLVDISFPPPFNFTNRKQRKKLQRRHSNKWILNRNFLNFCQLKVLFTSAQRTSIGSLKKTGRLHLPMIKLTAIVYRITDKVTDRVIVAMA